MTVDDVIRGYLKLRDKKEAIMQKAKEEAAAVDEKMNKLEAWLREQADTQGVTSFKTASGTAFVTTTDFANVADWDAIISYVKTNDAYDMLERRVSKSAVRARLTETGEIPPGVNYGTKIGVNVRRPATKAE